MMPQFLRSPLNFPAAVRTLRSAAGFKRTGSPSGLTDCLPRDARAAAFHDFFDFG
jgi:hypothetical protein